MKKTEEDITMRNYDSDYKEYCVMCNGITNIDVYEHVERREHYIDGAGQLCEECYKKINKN